MEGKRPDYRATLQLPKTGFAMKANLLQAEPQHQQRWDRIRLFERLRRREAPNGKFVFHDGPPYANGPIHVGHLLNKILKDLCVRTRLMSGYQVDYVPGWDCHGLPIEHKVLKELGEQAKTLSRSQVRKRCHDYAAKYVEIQAAQLKRLGTLADYDNPYLTMAPEYEGRVLDVFRDLVAAGIVFRDVKPVHWSVANKTALAEAELEYYDRTDRSIYVFFELTDAGALPESLQAGSDSPIWLMIWTTTPWTLPGNLAVAVTPEADYTLCEVSWSGGVRRVLIAEKLREAVLGHGQSGERRKLGSCRGRELVEAGLKYRHPFVDREGVVVAADYVTLEDGTGLVHTAPGHGAEDYLTGIQEGLAIYCPVQADGRFDVTVPEWLQGVDVWEGNDLIVDRLRRDGHLFFVHDYVHSYPHDWRSKTPTIFRATEQWFVAVDKAFGEQRQSLRQRALEAIEKVKFVPSWGKARFRGMIESRPDWCISRQRSWGLPIPAFVDGQGRVLMTAATVAAVADVVRQRGSDVWFEAAAEELLAAYRVADDPEAPEWARGGRADLAQQLKPGDDIFDVWFESGSSWNAVLRTRGIGYPADLYLEGSDQHRGWFQLSLLPALGSTGQSPFGTVLTHGFTLDTDGHKMSKSSRNAVEVEEVLKQYGADVCRWWVASLNFANDMKVDWEFFRVASEEYRKIRNTIRFLLGNLNDFDPAQDAVVLNDEDRFTVDGWAREKLAELNETVRSGYTAFDFKRVSEAIFNFCNETMSAVYMNALKDRLYCDPPACRRRRRTQTVLYEVAGVLIRAVAPILVHTAEEAWHALKGTDPGTDQESVHEEFLAEPMDWKAAPGWTLVMSLRQDVMKATEAARNDLGIKNQLDMGIRATVSENLFGRLEPFEPELADLCGVSRFCLRPGPAFSVEVEDLREEPRCDRSWKRDGTVARRSDGGSLSDRDAAAVGV